MLNLAVINVGNPHLKTHETALQLLQILDTRFFQEEPVFTDSLQEMIQQQQTTKAPLNDIQLATFYSRSQEVLAEQLAILHPDYTMPMFSGQFKFSKSSKKVNHLKVIQQFERLG